MSPTLLNCPLIVPHGAAAAAASETISSVARRLLESTQGRERRATPHRSPSSNEILQQRQPPFHSQGLRRNWRSVPRPILENRNAKRRRERERQRKSRCVSTTVCYGSCCVLPGSRDRFIRRHVVSKIPLMLEIMSKEPSVPEECYEFLFLASNARRDGVSRLYECGGMSVLASLMSNLPDGSQSVEFSMRLVRLVISTLSLDAISNEYPSELAVMVAAISKQFAVLHNALKFEALRLLSVILSSEYSAPLHEAR